MTPVLPLMIMLLPPAPPRAAHTSGFRIFMRIAGGTCGPAAQRRNWQARPRNHGDPIQRAFDSASGIFLSKFCGIITIREFSNNETPRARAAWISSASVIVIDHAEKLEAN